MSIRMIDVGEKSVTRREARAEAEVLMGPQALRLIREGRVPKGDVLTAARLAGIMAAKRTHELIPLCHPLGLESVEVEAHAGRGRVFIKTLACAQAKTGVEMEALAAASVAALTVYDMLKSTDKGMTIRVRLSAKSGGRSGDFRRKETAWP